MMSAVKAASFKPEKDPGWTIQSLMSKATPTLPCDMLHVDLDTGQKVSRSIPVGPSLCFCPEASFGKDILISLAFGARYGHPWALFKVCRRTNRARRGRDPRKPWGPPCAPGPSGRSRVSCHAVSPFSRRNCSILLSRIIWPGWSL